MYNYVRQLLPLALSAGAKMMANKFKNQTS
jgi:hypothetical protein